LHDECRAWKGHDWDALNRLHQKGYISNPASKAKSVVFTDKGWREAERLFKKFYARD
jgi:Mn-dependent DtxR family transcriptional regulator